MLGIRLFINQSMEKGFLKSDKLHLTDNISNKIVRLPMHYNMNEKDVDYVSEKIKYFFSKN